MGRGQRTSSSTESSPLERSARTTTVSLVTQLAPGRAPTQALASAPLDRIVVDSLSPAEGPHRETATPPVPDDDAPVRFLPQVPRRLCHGTPPLDHAPIVSWPARRGSPDAHVEPAG